jgi:hypothetical protein
MTGPSHRLALSLCAAVLGLLLCPRSFSAEPPWLEVHSTHFTVITDAGEKKGREVALRFEQMRAVFALLLGKEHLNQSVPLTILAFQNDKSYYHPALLRQGQPIDVPGFPAIIRLHRPQPLRGRAGAVAHDFAGMLLNYPPAQDEMTEAR